MALTRTSMSELATRVKDVVRTAETLSEHANRPDLAQALRATRESSASDAPRVVVFGETKAGKSALINALLGYRSLSPEDPSVATSVHLTFRYGEHDRAVVDFLDVGSEAREIAIDEIGDWAAEQGNPGNSRQVASVEVTVPAEVLKRLGINLIDTPGVAGLEDRHAEVALQSLQESDAVIFVLDADGEISPIELDFLERAAESVDTIIFTLTRTDLVPDWNRVAERSATEIAARIPRLAPVPVLAVRSRKVARALKRGADDDLARVRAAAGFEELEQTLRREVAERARFLQAANAVRLCLSCLAQLEAIAKERLDATAAKRSRRAELQAEKKRLQGLRAEWKEELNLEIQQIRKRFDDGVKDRLSELGSGYKEKSSKLTRAEEFQAAWDRFGSEAQLAIQDLTDQTKLELLAVLEKAFGTVEGDSRLAATLSAVGELPIDTTAEYQPSTRRKTLGERYRTVSPAIGLRGVAGALFAGHAIAGPIGVVVLAVPIAVFTNLQQHATERRDNFGKSVTRRVASMVSESQRQMAERIHELRTALIPEFREMLDRRLQELTLQEEELKKAESRTKDPQESALARAQAAVKEVGVAKGAAAELSKFLHTARVEPRPQASAKPSSSPVHSGHEPQHAGLR